jgi:hypothetical protein
MRAFERPDPGCVSAQARAQVDLTGFYILAFEPGPAGDTEAGLTASGRVK